MICPFHSREALPQILRAQGVHHVVCAGGEEMAGVFRRAGFTVTEAGGLTMEEAERICAGEHGPQALWLEGDLSYRGAVEVLEVWADALPDGAVLAGAGYVRTIYRNRGLPLWANVPDAIARVRRTRSFLTEPLLTWNEGWPSWLMFKRERLPAVEILSAATPDTPWWPEVEAHHRRYAVRHGYAYSGRTMEAPADRSPVWLKFALMLERLRDSSADWLFWLDGDAVFWDFSRPLHGYVPPRPWDGVFPQFWRGRDCLSSGAFLFRKAEATRQLLEQVWALGAGGGYASEEMRLADLAPFIYADRLPFIRLTSGDGGTWLHRGEAFPGAALGQKWLKQTVTRALDRWQLPAAPPELSDAELRRLWPAGVREATAEELPVLCDYPENGLFPHPLTRVIPLPPALRPGFSA